MEICVDVHSKRRFINGDVEWMHLWPYSGCLFPNQRSSVKQGPPGRVPNSELGLGMKV